jgi:hypothetical protein
LWRRFEEAKQTHTRLEDAIQVAREALDVERSALVQAQSERDALATCPLPTTVEEEASQPRSEALRRYQSLSTECQQRAAAITELERVVRASKASEMAAEGQGNMTRGTRPSRVSHGAHGP